MSQQIKRKREADKKEEMNCYVVIMKCDSVLHKNNTLGAHEEYISAPKSDAEEHLAVQEFNCFLDTILSRSENSEISTGEDSVVPKILQERQLNKLLRESAKLKNLEAMKYVPCKKLLRLLHLLERNISDDSLVYLEVEADNVKKEKDQRKGSYPMEIILRSLNVSLASLYILTSHNLPVQLYLEEIIDKIIVFTKHHLKNTIFPLYDSSYAMTDEVNVSSTQTKNIISTKRETKEQFILLSSRFVEIINLFTELLVIQRLTDNDILHLSNIAISFFFVENVNEFQLAALKLASEIYTRYEVHRILLLDDILNSMDQLPRSKQTQQSFRLNSTNNIQMITALIMQLIQCTAIFPEGLRTVKKETLKKQQGMIMDDDTAIINKYNSIVSVARYFLKSFLSKCSEKREEVNYKFLFEKFILDLTKALHQPEWPVAELLLDLIARFLLFNLKNKKFNITLRSASLDYLGIIATKVAKHNSQLTLDAILQYLQEGKNEELNGSENKYQFATPDQYLQYLLLDYLYAKKEADTVSAQHMYIVDWYKEAIAKIEDLPKEMRKSSKEKKKKLRHTNKSSHQSGENSSGSIDYEEIHRKYQTKTSNSIQAYKQFLISEIKKCHEVAQKRKSNRDVRCVDNTTAELISSYLATKRPLYQNFGIYLRQILYVLTENTSVLRTKAIKSLDSIIEADPSLLERVDVQKSVHYSFLDHSIHVREAAVDLVGKYVLNHQELLGRYYDMLSSRLLDTGISVRKRVIKIFKDVCTKYPDFSKVPEICAKILRRITDHESIRKLVLEVFQEMWFTSIDVEFPYNSFTLTNKVLSIMKVIATFHESEMIFFEQLLTGLFNFKANNNRIAAQVSSKALLKSCEEIVCCLVQNTLKSQENMLGVTKTNCVTSHLLVASFVTLKQFAKYFPELLVSHVTTLQPYLSIQCETQGDLIIVKNLAQILQHTVPLVDHPSKIFLSQIEEDLVKLILQQEPNVIQNCLLCLSTVINTTTRNYKLIQDIFERYYKHLMEYKNLYEKDPQNPLLIRHCPYIRRCLFSIGLLFRHFNFKEDIINGMKGYTAEEVFIMLVYYLECFEDLHLYSLKAIGFVCTRYYEFMFRKELISLYKSFLESDNTLPSMRNQVLNNLHLYIKDEQSKSIKNGNLKEIGNQSSERVSCVVQMYCEAILQLFLHSDVTIRSTAVKLIELVLDHGLIQPLQTIPYLICTTTDEEATIKHISEKLLENIEKKHPGFINMKVQQGIDLSYKLQKILQANNDNSILLRGYRNNDNGNLTASNSFLYSVVRNSVKSRRALITGLLKRFENHTEENISQLLFIADNLAYFPYLLQDEFLFVIHQIDSVISVCGTNITESFHEALLPSGSLMNMEFEEKSETAICRTNDDESSLLLRLPEDITALQNCIAVSHSFILLLDLKQHLQNMYSISEEKIKQYLPQKSCRMFDKIVKHCNTTPFTPRIIVQKLNLPLSPEILNNNEREALVKQYLYFKKEFDPEED